MQTIYIRTDGLDGLFVAYEGTAVVNGVPFHCCGKTWKAPRIDLHWLTDLLAALSDRRSHRLLTMQEIRLEARTSKGPVQLLDLDQQIGHGDLLLLNDQTFQAQRLGDNLRFVRVQ